MTRNFNPIFNMNHTSKHRARGAGVFTSALSTLLATAVIAHASTALDRNWAQWRGPYQNGVSSTANPPVEWSETKNVKWKVAIPGQGDSTPIIWDQKVFVLTVVPEDAAALAFSNGAASGNGMTNQFQWKVICLDRATGIVNWEKTAFEGQPLDLPNEGQHNTFASYSPVTDGMRLYVSFGSAGVYCYNFDGDLVWKRDLQPPGAKKHGGEGGSPVICDGTLIINWDHVGCDFITAFDAKSGDTIWKTPRKEIDSWFTPLAAVYEGKAQIITTGQNRIRSYDVATGQEIWNCKGLDGYSIPSPVASHGMVFAMTGFGGMNHLVAIKLGYKGDISGTDAMAWRHDKATSYIPSPLLYGDLLYFIKGNNNLLSCLDVKSGNALIDAERVAGLGDIYASPIGAAGRIYLLDRGGHAVVIKKSTRIDLVATNQLDDKFDASPAVAGNELFLRGKKYLYCLEEKSLTAQ